MNPQTDFLAKLRNQAARKTAGPNLARRMIAYLHVCGDRWVTRDQLRAAIGFTPRQCRLARESAHGRVIMGQRGYRLLSRSTPDEIHECLATFQSQIRAIQREHGLVCRRAHVALAMGDAMARLEVST